MTNIQKRVYADDNFIVKAKDDTEMLLRIVDDKDPRNPREWDHVGTMVCWHGRYDLGDEHSYSEPKDFLLTLALGKDADQREAERQEAHDNEMDYDPDDMSTEQLLNIINENHVILPLYLYDHSGITISTTSFLDQWDSGQVGWVYVNKETALAQYGNITKKNWRKVTKQRIDDEVQTYDDYLTGSVLGYQLYKIENNEATEMVDSNAGYYGNTTDRNGLLDGFTVLRPVSIKTMTTTRIFVL
jgi:hypothetical protein